MKRILAAPLLILSARAQSDFEEGRKKFESLCAPCHGADGMGGQRGPSIVDARRIRLRGDAELRDLIAKGVPASGMPGFPLPRPELDRLTRFVRALLTPAASNPALGDAADGEALFTGEGKCLSCHMVNGKGSAVGPDLTDLGNRRKLREIEQSIDSPGALITPGYGAVSVTLRDGRMLRGLARNQSNFDLQLQTLDGHLHLLQRKDLASVTADQASLMPAVKTTPKRRANLLAFLTRLPKPDALSKVAPAGSSPVGVSWADIAHPKRGEWPTYDGNLTGNRHSELQAITRDNVEQLGVRWMYSIPNARLQTTPIVAGGVMYITHGNDVHAVDAASGRLIWRWNRPKSQGLVGDPIRGFSRGLALLGDRVLFQTDNGHLVTLHRLSGSLLWDVDMVGDVPLRNHYGATSAPLVVNDLVIAGIAGGDGGLRGFLDAYKPETGERVWRFETLPRRGEPGSETWQGKALEVGCGSTWLTGTYDPALDLLYWTTGNPCPDYNGDERKGDNLYTSSILALKPKTGKLAWYYQVTPHDVHDFDAQQVPMLVDATYRGTPRKLLVQASRNGFFYVLDRTDGKLLSATPYLERLTWATGIGPDGRPKRVPGTEPSLEGSKSCPAPEGGNNWMSNSFDPATGLFYLVTLEKCSIYVKSAEWLIPGEQFYGGGARNVPGEPGRKYLRAIDLETGKVAWNRPMEGPATSWGGVVSTAGGLVFYCDDSGAFAAADSKTGETLWHFHTNQSWRTSPMTFASGGKQYVAVAAGASILVFGLP
ncbi:MAG: c-type cytochrome [Acidobacteria bacterium]|nr:c-type cytochrome [Acidobacteriota bacterium]